MEVTCSFTPIIEKLVSEFAFEPVLRRRKGNPGSGLYFWKYGCGSSLALLIILVFLWAMAKRGSKAVLAKSGGGERKRAVSTRYRSVLAFGFLHLFAYLTANIIGIGIVPVPGLL